MLIETTVLFQI